jgi:hypothetical protein
MRKTLNLLGWISVFVTIFTLVLTLLTTYQFIYIKYFDSYFTLQCCMVVTLTLFGVTMLDSKYKFKNVIFSLSCMALAVGTMFFILMRVY